MAVTLPYLEALGLGNGCEMLRPYQLATVRYIDWDYATGDWPLFGSAASTSRSIILVDERNSWSRTLPTIGILARPPPSSATTLAGAMT